MWSNKKQKLGHDLRDAELTTAAADYGGAGVSPRRGRHDPVPDGQPADGRRSTDRPKDDDGR